MMQDILPKLDTRLQYHRIRPGERILRDSLALAAGADYYPAGANELLRHVSSLLVREK